MGAGFYALLEYGSTPGEAGRPVSDWPAKSQVARDPSRANLVLAIHPHCPCSRATIDALAEVMARCQGLATAHVLFYRPADFPEGWERTDLWYSAAAIPGVATILDIDGLEASCFGAETSGQVMLYSARGELLFGGGITVSRGHQGSSPSLESLLACLTHGNSDRTPWPVFGCPLKNPEGTPQ
ncbi:hypothetical protein AYO40_02795 [Planctomycetaceae bacterium SCGC AG-212-D15]|nr:hypothetical protein AYO40_02795 [Planctomycetaceae bacterium SCGC AG-212-D15]